MATDVPAIFTRKLGPLPAWQWVAIVGGGAGVLIYIRRSRAAAAAAPSTTADLSGATPSPIPGSATLQPIILQAGAASTPAPSAPVATIPKSYGSGFINTTQYQTLNKAQQALLYPVTTSHGAHGYLPRGTPIPTGAKLGYPGARG